MNNVQSNTISPTMTIMTVSMALAGATIGWGQRRDPTVLSPQPIGSYSFLETSQAVTPEEREWFMQRISEIYASLSQDQEPLGSEFEAIWDENIGALYES